MKRLIQIAFALTLSLHFNKAFAQTAICPPIGEVVVGQDPAEVFETFVGFDLAKDEFETTQEHEARVQEALAGQDLTSVALASIFDPEYAEYDADAQAFNVVSFAWKNMNTDYSAVFRQHSEYGLQYAPSGNIDVALRDDRRRVSQYTATTALGASLSVDVIESERFSVFEGLAGFGSVTKSWNPHLVSLPVSRDRAREFRDGLQAVVVYAPVFPFALSATTRTQPTFQYPRDIRHTTNVLIGNISCVVLTDAEDRVVGFSHADNRLEG